MRKRSSYRPKGVNPTAHIMAMLGAARLTTTDVLIRAERVHLSVAQVCNGTATNDDWLQVFDAVNMAEQLIRAKLAAGRDLVDCLQDMIVAVLDRQRGTPSRALHQDEQHALRDFAEDYVGLLSGVTQQQYMIAQRGVEDRIRRILSGERIPASIRVVEAIA